MKFFGTVIAALFVFARHASADDGRLLDDETFAFRPQARLVIDGGVVVAAPTALATGFSKGLAAGVTFGDLITWGVRASYVSASEDSDAWQVTHREVRVLATGGVQHAIGRATVGLRLGIGGTLIHEDRLRHQGMRAGLTGDDLEMTAIAVVPTATLDGVIGLHVRGAWMVQLSAGPSVAIVDGGARGGWSALVGIAWHP